MYKGRQSLLGSEGGGDVFRCGAAEGALALTE